MIVGRRVSFAAAEQRDAAQKPGRGNSHRRSFELLPGVGPGLSAPIPGDPTRSGSQLGGSLAGKLSAEASSTSSSLGGGSS